MLLSEIDGFPMRREVCDNGCRTLERGSAMCMSPAESAADAGSSGQDSSAG